MGPGREITGHVFLAAWIQNLILNATWKPQDHFKEGSSLLISWEDPFCYYGFPGHWPLRLGQQCPEQAPAHIQVLTLCLALH